MQAVIAPTVTAYDLHEYRSQLEAIQPFAKRIHVDLMDGVFAPTISPPIESLWLPQHIQSDIHLMFQHPHRYTEALIALKPHMVIVPVEAQSDSLHKAVKTLSGKVKVGVSLLAETRVSDPLVSRLIGSADHVLIFSGHLGYHGGTADMSLLSKVLEIRALRPEIEIGWDGGISINNVQQIRAGGVDVLNVGSAIQKHDDPHAQYIALTSLV
jgi:ribulose-phosphate 3-epimerase